MNVLKPLYASRNDNNNKIHKIESFYQLLYKLNKSQTKVYTVLGNVFRKPPKRI